MSRLSGLMQEICPDGVEYEALGKLGAFYGGLTGKSKKDFGAGSKFVTYNNVYRNPAVDVEEYGLVNVGPNERQNTVEFGDVLFTISSENREEAGLTSVMMVDPGEPWYLNSFCTGWRLHDRSLLLPDFLKHVLRSPEFRKAISRTANGVTRFNISKPRLAKVRIPVPPIEVQRKVVRILDEYTAAHDELVCRCVNERELLEAQKVALCDELICRDGYNRMAIGTLGTLMRGKRFTAADYVIDGIPSIHYGEVYTEYGVSSTETVSHLREDMRYSLRFAESGDVIIACTGENKDDICKPVAWLGEGKVAVHDDCQIFHHSMNPRYVAYALLTTEFHDQKVRAATESKVVRVSGKKLSSMIIPVPPIERQREIADTLDQAFSLTEQLIAELTTEIELLELETQELRTQLLTFPEKTA